MSRSGYYRKKIRIRATKTSLEQKAIACFKKHKGNYGRIRIRKELLRDGISVSENKIAKILKKHGYRAKCGRTGHYHPLKPTEIQYFEENLVKDKFSAKVPNMLWCSDITELKCRNTKLYLCCVIDVATRKIVGWAIDRRQFQDLVQKAFIMAVNRTDQIPEGAVYHSDRGCQYTARKTKMLVEQAGFKKSMSRPGRPNDNQPIESFWHTLEVELEGIHDENYKDARIEIIKYIELYYNSMRLHSGIGYMTPDECFALHSVYKC